MKDYEIVKIEEKYIVIATSYVNPIDELDHIAKELEVRKCYGDIIFDLLLCNGLNSNRFLSINFDGNKFNLFSARKMRMENESIIKGVTRYLIQKGYIDNGILQHSQIYALKRNY